MSDAGLQVIDRLEVLVCGLDPEGVIQIFNELCERVTGLKRCEAVGRSWIELFASGARTDHVLDLWAQARGRTASGPFEALCRNQRNLRWQFSVNDHDLPPNVVLWAVGIDVTAEREALVRARELERIRALGNLVSGLTHELRNPLNGLLLQLALADRTLERRQDQSLVPLQSAISHAATEARRISHILDDFLLVARPLPLELRRADIRRIVRFAIDRSDPRAKAAGVEVRLEAADDIAVEVDASRVESAVYQLLANAIDAAADSAEPVVTVTIAVAGNSVAIDVEDRGPGIPSPETPLFEPFFTTKTGGTGLGLAIVQRVAVDHGGTITHTRRDGVTVFRLELPIVAN